MGEGAWGVPSHSSVRLDLGWLGRLFQEGSWHRGCHSLQQGHRVTVTGGAQRCPQHILPAQFAVGDTQDMVPTSDTWLSGCDGGDNNLPDPQQCADRHRAHTEGFWLFLQESCARIPVPAAAGLVTVLLPQPGCCSVIQLGQPSPGRAPSHHQSMGMLHPRGQRWGILPLGSRKLEDFMEVLNAFPELTEYPELEGTHREN